MPSWPFIRISQLGLPGSFQRLDVRHTHLTRAKFLDQLGDTKVFSSQIGKQTIQLPINPSVQFFD